MRLTNQWKESDHLKIQTCIPPLTSFTMYAAPLSIIAHEAKAYDWIYSNFNLLCCFKHDYKQLGIFYSPLEVRRYCPWIQYQKVEKEILKLNEKSLIHFLEEQINNNNGIYMYVNHKYFKQSELNIVHDLFIYGIDTYENKLYAADNCVGGYYSNIEISFQEMIAAYINDDSFEYSKRDSIELLSLIKDREYSFCLPQFRNEIIDSLHSRCSDPRNDVKDSMIFGLEVYDRVIEHINVISAEGPHIDIRAFYVLWEHKNLMQERIEFLLRNGYIQDKDEKLVKQIKLLVNDLKKMKNLAIKRIIIGNNKGLQELIILIRQIKENEELFLRNLLDSIADL